MDKTISLQAAIDLWDKYHPYIATKAMEYDRELRALPSAQPEPIKINIEDFNKEDWERLKKEWGNTPITVLSAQPEIIRCKDCKHRPTATRSDEEIFYGFSVEFPDEKCPCYCEDGWYGWYPEDDFYCGYAERREE